jgi:riboflavin synthase
MFTGIIECPGRVERSEPDGHGGLRFTIRAPMAVELTLGESVAVSGACLTVIAHDESGFTVQAGPETLSKTTLGSLAPGESINLERSLRLGDRLGGHLVQGHVDGIGRIAERIPQGDWELFWFEAPRELLAQMVNKGSVAVDGISLTIVDAQSNRFSVALIPHTLAVTTLASKPIGASVNLETDLIGKYVSKWMQSRNQS